MSNEYIRIWATEQEGLQMLPETENDGADVMSDGSSFHRVLQKTGNARLTIIVTKKDGTIRRLEDADLSLCQLDTSATRVKYDDR